MTKPEAPPEAAPPAKIRSNAGRFVKGRSANPAGKRKGTLARKTILAAKLMASIDVPGILSKLEKQALKGDHGAAKLLLDRAMPVRRGCPIAITLPPIVVASDAVAAMGKIAAAVSAGKVSPSEAMELSAVVDAARKAIELLDVEIRLKQLEDKFK
jgi:hypothetical protein